MILIRHIAQIIAAYIKAKNFFTLWIYKNSTDTCIKNGVTRGWRFGIVCKEDIVLGKCIVYLCFYIKIPDIVIDFFNVSPLFLLFKRVAEMKGKYLADSTGSFSLPTTY